MARGAIAVSAVAAVRCQPRQQPIQLPGLDAQQHVAGCALVRGPVLAKGQQLVQRLLL